MGENNGNYSNVAVLIPCYNEALTVASVVGDFYKNLPGAAIYVGDNNSTDSTGNAALATGKCEVIKCPAQGKGAAVRTLLCSLDADKYEYYILVDGDATYDAKHASLMLGMLESHNYDMVSGDRLSSSYIGQKRSHEFGNHLVDGLINAKYNTDCVKDAMSGLRAFNRNVAENFAMESEYDGFEIEVELVMWCLRNKLKICSIGCDYAQRPEGSVSKLSTIRDGAKILMAIAKAKRK